MILAFFVASDKAITYLICEKRSLLLANDTSVNTSNCRVLASSLTNLSPLSEFSICYAKRLFRVFASSLVRLVT
jgi:hypothetical protein